MPPPKKEEAKKDNKGGKDAKADKGSERQEQEEINPPSYLL